MTIISHKEYEVFLKNMEKSPKTLGSQDRVATLILGVSTSWKDSLTEPYMEGVDGAPAWLEFEHKIWELGEKLRHVLKANRWKGKCPVLDAAVKILSCKDYRKGRQTFALLIGEFGQGNYGIHLAECLTDEEVSGHCLKAMTKAKISGFGEHVRRILDSSEGWQRKAAEKYLTLYQ